MKIGLNGTCFNNRPSGARQRFIGIYQPLVKRLPDAEFVIYEPVDCAVGAWFEDAANVSVRKTPIPSEGRLRKLFNGLGYWHSALKREQFTLFEGFNLPLIKPSSGKTVLTIHDIRFVYSDCQGKERFFYKKILENAIRKADHVLTVSASMQEEIAKLFPDACISVIYNGLDAEPFNEVTDAELAEVRTRLSLPDNYLLAVGHLEHRKNHLRLLSAVSQLRADKHKLNLIIVGNDNGAGAEIRQKITQDNLTGCVRLLSGLSDHDVRCLYKLSQLFVFISAYEGFGIPVLEAMAAHKPMVLSDIAVFREITQDQGVYVSPHDINAIADAIASVLSSEDTRQRLVQYGDKRITDFNFANLARQLAELYSDLK